MADIDALTAAHRFGMGARLGELDTIAPDPANWLNAQLTDVSSTLEQFNLIDSTAALTLFFDYLETKRQEDRDSDAPVAMDAPVLAGTMGAGKNKRTIGGAKNKRARYTAFFDTVSTIKRQEQMQPPKRRASTPINTISSPKAQSDEPIFYQGPPTSDELIEQMYESLTDDIAVRTQFATTTPASFRERLVRFWSDHFSIDFNKNLITVPTALTMEREAIRPHVTGKFYDMLVAVESHQGMLLYLDNWTSFGPNSWAGLQFGLGLNENLARETLELHTLGVGGGYSQDDIIEYAKAITGWTIGNPNVNQDQLGQFVFDPLFHEPGTRTIMGKSYPDTGITQALTALQDFARHPSTANHIARKLAAHFHSDTPPQSLIDRLSQVFTDTDGDLLQVSLALVAAPEMWDNQFLKLRNSEEFLIAAYRAFNFATLTPEVYFYLFEVMAQIPFSAGSPAGWPDDEASWASSSVIAARLNLAVQIGQNIENAPLPPDYATDILGPILSTNSFDILAGAFTKAQGYALMLMTPELQRR